jgi:hypothetical protein
MLRARSTILFLGYIGIAVVAVAACGGGSSAPIAQRPATQATTRLVSHAAEPVAERELAIPSSVAAEVIAKVDGHAITKGLLVAWMREKVGQLFYEVSTHRAPTRLVTEPANYPACVASLARRTPIPGLGRPQPQPTTAQLTTRCEEIYREFRKSALTYLISAYWTQAFAAAHGIAVSEAEAQQRLKRLDAELYPTEEKYRQYLYNHTQTLRQALFELKVEMIHQKLDDKLTGGDLRLIAEVRQAAANAECRPGYVVENCRGYHPSSEKGPVGSVLLEEIARWRPETSHGFTGVPVN